jgi:hypothetical protein
LDHIEDLPLPQRPFTPDAIEFGGQGTKTLASLVQRVRPRDRRIGKTRNAAGGGIAPATPGPFRCKSRQRLRQMFGLALMVERPSGRSHA